MPSYLLEVSKFHHDGAVLAQLRELELCLEHKQVDMDDDHRQLERGHISSGLP